MAESSAGIATSPSGLKKSPSYREAQELLEQHIRRQRILKKYGSRGGVQSPSDVRKEAEKILNEFLKKQLRNDIKRPPILSQHYQKVVVENEYEKTEHFDDEYIMKGENMSGDEYEMHATFASADAIDNIPFIDGVEDDDGRSRSLPSSIQHSVKQPSKPMQSKSLTPQTLPIQQISDRRDVKVITPASDSRHSKSPSPRNIAKSIEIDNVPKEPPKERRRFRSGSISSSDTESGSVISPDRKKKTVFKRLQERIARVVSRDREKMHLDGKESPDVSKKKTKKRKARSKKRKDKDEIEILKEKHTHREGCLEQHHSGQNKDILLRTDETWESTDITDFEKSQNKHLDKYVKTKESTDLSASSEKGFFGAIKRMTSKKNKKNKSPKTSIKSSQSAYTQEPPGVNGSTKSYDRILSLPSGSHDLNLHLTETTSHSGGVRQKVTTKTITSPRSHDRQESHGLPKMGPIHEKSRSEPVQPSQQMVSTDHTGSTIPHGFRFREVSRVEDVKLPENGSFTINYSVDEKERTIRTKDGEVKIETDIHRSQKEPSDIEIDGAGVSIATGGRSPRQSVPKKTLPESDLDDDPDEIRISRVAARIAEMGDTYISEASHVGSPTSDERDDEGLTELERKIRDCFRDFGDTVNERLSMSLEPKDVAINIAKQVTYSKFKDTVQSVVGDNIGWQQLAMVFYVTKKATQLAGAGGAVASQLKENCLQYVEDHFASWILNQGGWDSVLESDETDFDID